MTSEEIVAYEAEHGVSGDSGSSTEKSTAEDPEINWL